MMIKRKSHDEVAFQLAPMIDMTFLLLIFFMVTTKISREQIKLDIKLPLASNAVSSRDKENREIISVDQAGAFFIGDEPATREELKAHLKRRFDLKAAAPLRLYVRADAKTPGKSINDVMRIAADAGAIDVIFGTYQD